MSLLLNFLEVEPETASKAKPVVGVLVCECVCAMREPSHVHVVMAQYNAEC